MKPIDSLRRWRGGTTLSTPVLAAVAAALAALAAAAVAFAVLIEDVAAKNGLEATDPHHLRFFTSHRSTIVVHAARVVTEAGAIGVLVPLAIVVAGVLWWRRVPIAFAVAPLVALLGAGAVTSIIKGALGRARPPIGLRLMSETEPSFPSGHAGDGTAFWVALGLVVAVALFHRPLARCAVALAGAGASVVVGMSRLVLGVHWPTDVMAGWALGAAAALTVILLAALVTHPNPGSTHTVGWHRRAMARLGARRDEPRRHGLMGIAA